jgi:hypothetical protein
MPNIIMHPTRRNGIDSTTSFFGRVMMSVGCLIESRYAFLNASIGVVRSMH